MRHLRDIRRDVMDGRMDGRTDGRTDRQTDRRTDTPSYSDAMTHLKMFKIFKDREKMLLKRLCDGRTNPLTN